MTQLTASDGHILGAYEVHPDGATASVVIIQEIFGVNSHIRSVVDRYASLGFHAIAPAVFDRVERDVELDYNPEGMEKGRGIVGGMTWEQTMLNVGAAVACVAGSGPTAVIGYCYGGSVAWLSAHSLPIAAAVGYYGGQIRQFSDKEPKAATMLHFGALDNSIPLSDIDEVAAAHPEVVVHIYDQANHGFSCDARGSHHAESAQLALGRTVAFLAEHEVVARR
jgi:carboxymethylenebutenolidase